MSSLRIAAALAAGVLVSQSVAAQAPISSSRGAAAVDPRIEQRLDRIERQMSSSALMRMLQRMDELQKEVQSLRSELEQMRFAQDQTKRRQRDLYLDVDRRLGQLERGGVRAPAAAALPATPVPEAITPVDRSPDVIASQSSAAEPADAVVDETAAQADYDRAIEMLREGQYKTAAGQFKVFLEKHAGSRLSGNAQYWLGEAHYVTREFDAALKEFNVVLSDYRASSKVADAGLKIGYIHYELSQWSEARTALQAVIDGQPQSTAARLAAKRLKRIREEGH